jgi:hypothetical protein
MRQVRMHLAERASRARVPTQERDLDARVRGEQPNQLASGVSGGPEDGDAERRGRHRG